MFWVFVLIHILTPTFEVDRKIDGKMSTDSDKWYKFS